MSFHHKPRADALMKTLCMSIMVTTTLTMTVLLQTASGKVPDIYEGLKPGATFEEVTKSVKLVSSYEDKEGNHPPCDVNSVDKESCEVFLNESLKKKYKFILVTFKELQGRVVLEKVSFRFQDSFKADKLKQSFLKEFGSPSPDKKCLIAIITGTSWCSEDNIMNFSHDTLSFEWFGIKKANDIANKFQDEEKFSCSSGLVDSSIFQTSTIAQLNSNPTGPEDDEDIEAYVRFCILKNGLVDRTHFETKVGADANGYLKLNKEVTYQTTDFDASKLEGPMWIWDSYSHKLLQKRIYKAGKRIKTEQVNVPLAKSK